jgi:spore germination protein YaaH
MLYNQHSRRTPPGPIATPLWIEEVLSYAREQCDPRRIVPVLKVSGMEWGASGARGIQFEEAIRLRQAHGAAPQRDPAAKVPFFSYVRSGSRHTVYFEDARSLIEKTGTIAALGLDRIVFWSLGRHDPGLLEELRRRGDGTDRRGER